MKIGISWNAYGDGELGIKEQIALMKKYGFEATFAMSDDKNLDRIVEAVRCEGITPDTCHAPFRGINRIWFDNSNGDDALKMLKDSVDACARNSIPVDVVHLSSGDNAPRISDAGYRHFKELVYYADVNGVKIAFENQRKLANIAFAFEEFPTAGFCWDVGHEACFAYGREYMPLFGSRLVALHIHDNFAVHEGDRHMIPFDAGLDFDKAAGHITRSGFDGTVMLELMRHTSGEYENYTPDEYYSKAAKAAARIRDMIEEKRKKDKKVSLT
ncbi:MAG: sugar phosphate isomerase/epimerase, partial [Clostridia bacterium]|nr:sugar phosphate isomerase/epimerase [Clostridia bacterium]